MKTLTIVLLVFVGLLIAGGIMGVTTYISYKNQFVEQRGTYNAQLASNKAYLDAQWKTFRDQTRISEEYAEQVKELYIGFIEGKYQNGVQQSGFMTTLQDVLPNFDQSMFKDLMITIESKRADFAARQTRLADIHRELVVLKEKPVSGFFLSGEVLPELILVTSTRTENSFATGKDDAEDVTFKSSKDTTKRNK